MGKHDNRTNAQLLEELNEAYQRIAELEAAEIQLKQSEARLRSLAHALPDLIFFVDRHGTVIDIMTSQEELLVVTADQIHQLKGRHLGAVIPKELSEQMMNNVHKTMHTGKAQALEYELEVTGGYRWLDARTSLMPSSDPDENLVVFVVRDITDRKHAEETLLYQASLLESIPEAIISNDPDFNIRSWNKAAERIYGWTEEEVLGRNTMSLFQAEYLNQQTREQAYQQAREQGFWRGEITHLRKDGTRIPIYSSTTFIEDDQGKVIGILSVLRDITEEKQAEQQRLDLLLERERVEILASFINQASHEFKTPFSIISTSAHLLKRAQGDEAKSRHISKIEAQVAELTMLVDELTILSALDRQQNLDMSPINLNDIVHMVHGTNQAAHQTKNLRVDLQLGDLSQVQGSLGNLRQAIECIWDNAIRFTPAGGTITVRTFERDNRAVIEIKDTGMGIDDQDLPNIFERFYRSDKVGTERGFGLGLAIAKTIIDQFQGDIEVETAVGEGSTFRILLPMSN